jgi:HEAT repeat protein
VIARRRAVVVATLATAALAHAVRAQSLAARVDAVRDGSVILSFAGRPGLCGDGGDMIWFGDRMYGIGQFGHFRGDTPPCYAGPVEVTIGRASGETISIRTRVGRRASLSSDATTLGTVSARDAAAFFFAQSRAILGRRNGEQALIAAVVADSVSVTAPLLQVIRDGNVRLDLRQFATMLLGDSDEPDSHTALRGVISDADLPGDVRGSAIIALGQRDIALTDAEFLERQYATLGPKLRDNVFLALSRSDDPRIYRWLAGKALDASEATDTRKQALFWLGQGGMPTAELVGLYDHLEPRELREHFTFVLSQRKDDQAVDKLIDIVNHERDKGVRSQALFWLGQSKEPRARAFLRDLILKEEP